MSGDWLSHIAPGGAMFEHGVEYDHHLDLGGAPGRANTGDKLMTLVASALAGGDCIDDADALRAGRTSSVLGGTVKAPSIHPGHLPAQLSLGPRAPVGPGKPRVAGTGLAGWHRTRRRTIHHRPGLHHLRDLRAPRRALATTAITASGAITRCWPWPPAPATC